MLIEYNIIQYKYLHYSDKRYISYTNDAEEMICKPPSHTGLICHFIKKVQEKIRGKYSTF